MSQIVELPATVSAVSWHCHVLSTFADRRRLSPVGLPVLVTKIRSGQRRAGTIPSESVVRDAADEQWHHGNDDDERVWSVYNMSDYDDGRMDIKRSHVQD